MSDIPIASQEVPPIGLRRILELAWKSWPFVRPMVRHLIALLGAVGLIVLIASGAGLLASDLFFNKVLVGDKLQPRQAVLLLLDEQDYVASDVASDVARDIGESADEGEILTTEQRITVRNRLLVWAAVVIAPFSLLVLGLMYYNTWIWQMINQNLRVAMISKAEHLSLKYHNDSRVGDAIFRVYQDGSTITSFLQNAFVQPLSALYNSVVALVLLSLFDPRLAAACILILVPMVLLTVWFTPVLRDRAMANRIANSNLTSRLQETMTALKIVKANQGERKILDHFDRDSHAALDAALYVRFYMLVLSILVGSLAALTVIGLEYVMIYWVLGERETFFGAAVATVIGFTLWNYGAFQGARGNANGALFSATGLVATWSRLQDLLVGLERAFYLLDLEADIVDPTSPVDFPGSVRKVTWDHVRFGYDHTRPVLNDIDLTAVNGVTAVVGSSGAGKSTMMSMLLRLFDPDAGSVRINGEDLRSFRVQDIRDRIAIVLQKNVLFAGTVADNIGYAAINPSKEAIREAAGIACADGFIQDLEAGYETELGERGGKLSTGQRQRISIARAVLRDTPILILDEPTASLDTQTELDVMRNLGQWGEHRVVFVITHRLSTIRNADQIVFLDDGRLMEAGSHDELMALGGRYQKFVRTSGVSDVEH